MPSNIRLLDDQVINKIAAGEVVENPASVIKELIDNAIDAGASRVDVTLKQGGLKLISVADNGSGMSEEDAQLSLKRHATSKIQVADDLFDIKTMGFRGEALASIAAVSRLTMMSRLADKEAGCRLQMSEAKGEQSLHCSDWHGPVGTQIVIEDLFYNIPARRKFLKSEQREYAACVEILQAFALSHPEVGFYLRHNDKDMLNLPALVSLKDGLGQDNNAGEGMATMLPPLTRLQQFFPREDFSSFQRTESSSRYGTVRAFFSPPGVEKASAKYIFTFVNGRLIKDKNLRFATMRGYHSHLLKGRYPFVVLFLQVDPSLIDVNVHPAKTEVRFQYERETLELVSQTIRDTLRRGTWAHAPSLSSLRPSSPAGSGNPFSAGGSSGGVSSGERSGASHPGYLSTAGTSQPKHPSSGEYRSSTMHFDRSERSEAAFHNQPSVTSRESLLSLLNTEVADSNSHIQMGAGTTSDPARTYPNINSLDYIGTFADCFLMFGNDEYLLLVDQHAFHERILFEKLAGDATLLNQAQALLMPELIELTVAQVGVLKDHIGDLEKRGFKLDFVDQTSIEVRQVPSILAGKNIQNLLAELAIGFSSGGEGADGEDGLGQMIEDVSSTAGQARLILATIACHAAVRAGEHLTSNELTQMMRQAASVDFYHNCPHGRPVFKWWSRQQVSRWFERT